MHFLEVNRKTRNDDGEYWIWPGCNAITHFNDSQEMNIDTATEIKLKLRVSVPGWPEKTCDKKTRGEKKRGKSEAGQVQLTSPARTLNKLLKTATDKSRIDSNKTSKSEYWKITEARIHLD